MNRQAILILAIAVGAGLALTYLRFNRQDRVRVEVPNLSITARRGGAIFEANCKICHGGHGGGTENGPPLVHKIYEPGHHSDQSFFRAVQNGVKAHHWPFGDMPPVENVKPDQVALVVQYIRELQRANGIQ